MPTEGCKVLEINTAGLYKYFVSNGQWANSVISTQKAEITHGGVAYAYIYIYVYIYTHVYIYYIYIYMYTYIHAYIQRHVFVHAHVSVRAYLVSACMCLFT